MFLQTSLAVASFHLLLLEFFFYFFCCFCFFSLHFIFSIFQFRCLQYWITNSSETTTTEKKESYLSSRVWCCWECLKFEKPSPHTWNNLKIFIIIHLYNGKHRKYSYLPFRFIRQNKQRKRKTQIIELAMKLKKKMHHFSFNMHHNFNSIDKHRCGQMLLPIIDEYFISVKKKKTEMFTGWNNNDFDVWFEMLLSIILRFRWPMVRWIEVSD